MEVEGAAAGLLRHRHHLHPVFLEDPDGGLVDGRPQDPLGAPQKEPHPRPPLPLGGVDLPVGGLLGKAVREEGEGGLQGLGKGKGPEEGLQARAELRQGPEALRVGEGAEEAQAEDPFQGEAVPLSSLHRRKVAMSSP